MLSQMLPSPVVFERPGLVLCLFGHKGAGDLKDVDEAWERLAKQGALVIVNDDVKL
jgi:hypothetical protein